MIIRELLARKQRNFIVAVFLAWLASFAAMVTLRPQSALLITCAAIAVMLAAFVYLYRSARCPRCATKLWLLLYKLVPIGPFRSHLNHCPACGASVSEPAEA
jgi:hypothetical protein